MSLFKQHIGAMSAYCPPLEGRDPKTHLLLDFNERTLPVGRVVQDALIAFIRDGRLQVYPSYGDVVDNIASYANVRPAQLMITNGSDQGIDLVFRAACREGDEVIIPEPSFAMYRQCASVENVQIIAPHYTLEGGFPLDQVLAAITSKTRIVVISNPNNPCGSLCSKEAVTRVAKAAPHAVILVDECYFEYCGLTLCGVLDHYPNIVVVRTFSKTWGLPSLRLGYVLSHQENIRTLLNVRGPYDINQLAVVAIQAALKNHAFVDSYVEEVMSVSKPAFESFLRESGIPFWPSAANFLWVFPVNPLEVERALVQQGILVRPKEDASGQLGLRVSLGDGVQTERLIQCWRKLISC